MIRKKLAINLASMDPRDIDTRVGAIVGWQGSNPPHYSTVGGDVLKALEWLRQSYKWCCIEISSDHGYVWDIRLTPAQDYSDPKQDKKYRHKPTIFTPSWEAMPMAICEVVLLAAEET